MHNGEKRGVGLCQKLCRAVTLTVTLLHNALTGPAMIIRQRNPTVFDTSDNAHKTYSLCEQANDKKTTKLNRSKNIA